MRKQGFRFAFSSAGAAFSSSFFSGAFFLGFTIGSSPISAKDVKISKIILIIFDTELYVIYLTLILAFLVHLKLEPNYQ